MLKVFTHFHTNKSFNKYKYEIIMIIMISVTFNSISTEKKTNSDLFSFFLFFPKVKGKVL